jgi:hypothetical protein
MLISSVCMIADSLSSQRHDPDKMSPIPRSESALLTTGNPTQDAWASAYGNDKDCKFMINNLSIVWSDKKVREVSPCFH